MVCLGLIQMSCTTSQQDNFEKAVEKIRLAASQGAQLVCSQELFLHQYFCQQENMRFFDLAQPIPGPHTKTLGQLARQLNIVIVASLFERRAAGIYHNTAVVLDTAGELVGRYRKMHIPDDPFYCEKFYFTPGDLGFNTHATPHGRLGLLVCWDQWFPEAARLTALRGAKIILCPTAIGQIKGESDEVYLSQKSAWETI